MTGTRPSWPGCPLAAGGAARGVKAAGGRDRRLFARSEKFFYIPAAPQAHVLWAWLCGHRGRKGPVRG